MALSSLSTPGSLIWPKRRVGGKVLTQRGRDWSAISNLDGHHLVAKEDNYKVTGHRGGDGKRFISIGNSQDSRAKKEQPWFSPSG